MRMWTFRNIDYINHFCRQTIFLQFQTITATHHTTIECLFIHLVPQQILFRLSFWSPAGSIVNRLVVARNLGAVYEKHPSQKPPSGEIFSCAGVTIETRKTCNFAQLSRRAGTSRRNDSLKTPSGARDDFVLFCKSVFSPPKTIFFFYHFSMENRARFEMSTRRRHSVFIV